MNGTGIFGMIALKHITLGELPTLCDFFACVTIDGAEADEKLLLWTEDYFVYRNTWIEYFISYVEHLGKEKLAALLSEKPINDELPIKLEAAAIALIQSQKFGIEPPVWIYDDDLSNSWRTPFLGIGAHPIVTQHEIDILENEDPFFFEHAMILNEVCCDIV